VKEANIQGSTPNMQYQSQKGSRRSKSAADWASRIISGLGNRWTPDRMDRCAHVGCKRWRFANSKCGGSPLSADEARI